MVARRRAGRRPRLRDVSPAGRSAQGAVAGSRRLRGRSARAWRASIQIGIPTNRLGVMLTFSSAPHAGGREGLSPLSKSLDVVKWEALAAKQVSSELHLASIWSWGWAAFSPAGNDPDKPIAACTWLWTRDHALCDAPSLAGPSSTGRWTSARCRRPTASACSGRRSCSPRDVAALSRLTGDREPRSRPSCSTRCWSRPAPCNARRGPGRARRDRRPLPRQPLRLRLGARRCSCDGRLARRILGDELRRREVEAGLRVPAPTAGRLTPGSTPTAGRPPAPSGSTGRFSLARRRRRGIALAQDAPGLIFTLGRASRRRSGAPTSRRWRGRAPRLVPLPAGGPSVRRALLAQARHIAFATWSRRRQNQSLRASPAGATGRRSRRRST